MFPFQKYMYPTSGEQQLSDANPLYPALCGVQSKPWLLRMMRIWTNYTPLLTLIFWYENEMMKVPFQEAVINIQWDNACQVFNSVPTDSRCSLKLAVIKTGPVVLEKLGLKQITSSFQEPALIYWQFSQELLGLSEKAVGEGFLIRWKSHRKVAASLNLSLRFWQKQGGYPIPGPSGLTSIKSFNAMQVRIPLNKAELTTN